MKVVPTANPKHDFIDAFDDQKTKNLAELELDATDPANYISMMKPNELSAQAEIENNHHRVHLPMQINLPTTPVPVSPLSTRIQDYLSEETFYNLVNEIAEPQKTSRAQPQKTVYY